jgi:hypothetical protein
MQLFRDWFSLLNRGERVAAVGSSDSHTVGDPVGQGRTYVASSTDEPAAIDLDEACTNIREGRSTLSLGIFVEVEVDAAFGPGALVPLSEDGFEVGLRIACPRWVRPERARIFVNGIERHGVALEELTASDAQQPGFETSLTARIDWPHAHDAWVVCVVDGAEAGRPFWPMTNAYTLGASNPVFIDADRDGAYSPPRVSARRLLDRSESGGSLALELASCDPAVGVHLLDLFRLARAEETRTELREAWESAGAAPWVGEWLESLPPVR